MNFKLILSMAISLCLTTTTVFAHDYSNLQVHDNNTEAIEKEILRLEEVGRQKALKGDSDWDDLIAEGAHMIAYDGSIIKYEKGLRLPSFPMKSFNMSEMIARVYGDVAVVTGLAEVEGETAEEEAVLVQDEIPERVEKVWRWLEDSRVGTDRGQTTAVEVVVGASLRGRPIKIHQHSTCH